MRTVTIIRAAILAASLTGLAGAVHAQEAVDTDAVAPDTAVSVAPQGPVAPWYQEFTDSERRFDLSGAPLDPGGATVEFDAGSNWGLSLGFEGGARRDEDLDGVSAGAFYRLTPRMRVGGELGYRARQNDPAGLRPDEVGAPQVKLQSAFSF